MRRLVAYYSLLVIFLVVKCAADDAGITAWTTFVTGGAMHFQWSISTSWSDTNSVDDIEGFRILVDQNEVETISATTDQYDLYGLRHNTEHSFQVVAVLRNARDGSTPSPLASDVISSITSDLSQPGICEPPTLLTVTSGAVHCRVRPPLDTGGAELVKMTVVVRSTTDSSWFSQMIQDTNSDYTASFYGLNATTSYVISAFGTNRGYLVAQESSALMVRTYALQVPDPCPAPTQLNVTGASVGLQLNAPLDDGGGRIFGYNVYMTTNDVEHYQLVAQTTGTATISMTEVLYSSGTDNIPLLPETTYRFKAVALNGADVANVSSVLKQAKAVNVTTTAATAPGSPPSPYFLGATGGMISISLIKPLNMRGSVLLGFSVIVNDSNGVVLFDNVTSSETTAFNVTLLRANSSYAISVAAVTNLGISQWSIATLMNTTATIPSSPQNATVANVMSGSAQPTWTPPFDSDGANLTGHTILATSNGGKEEEAPTALLTNLIANTAYTVKVIALNSVGKTRHMSATSGISFMKLAPTIPSEPWNLSSVFSSGGGFEVAWDPPTNRGGEKLLQMVYNATAFSVSSCFDNSASAPCLRCNAVKTLAVGTYEMINTSSVCAQPSSTCPDGSSNCCLTREDSKYNFGLECGRMIRATVSRIVVGTTSAYFNGLNSSTEYYFGVRASNEAGQSPISVLVGYRTTSQTTPTYPTNIRQVAVTGGSIQLTWDEPLDTGGVPVTGYRVYRDYMLLTLQNVSPPYTDCGLIGKTSYVYGITALNAPRGEGEMASMSLTTGPTSTPMPPTLSLVESRYNLLQVSVDPPCDTGGAATLSYKYVVYNGGDTIASDYFVCCDFTVQNLQSSTSYLVQVKVGNSSWVVETYSTTTGVPGRPEILLKVNTYSVDIMLRPTLDNEILSYDVILRQNTNVLQGLTVPCQINQYLCPASYRLESLEPVTDYEIELTAQGPAGSSDKSTSAFTTSSVSNGTFGMAEAEYIADVNGIANTVVLRSNGTSGSAVIGVDVIETSAVLARCEVVINGCYCTLYLSTPDIESKSCEIPFEDGQDSASVAFSLWNGDSAAFFPSQVVVGPFDAPLSGQYRAILLSDSHQQSGFVSFSMTASEVWENVTFAMVKVVRLNGTRGDIRFNYKSFDISTTAGIDYLPVNGSVVLLDQQSSTKFWIRIFDNYVYDSARTFGIRLTNPSAAYISDILAIHNVTIRDDESLLNELPDKVDDLDVTHKTGGVIGIQWRNASSSDGKLAIGYLVRATAAGSSTFSSLFNTTATDFKLSGLRPNSSYKIEVAAWNAFGLGQYSNVLEVTTTDTTAPSLPLSLNAPLITNTKVLLMWEPPEDDGGSSIVGYLVTMMITNGNVWRTEWVGASEASFTVDGLSASTNYTFSVTSETTAFPTNTNAASSAQISVFTAIGSVPDPPPAVQLVSQPRGGTLVFLLIRPHDTGGLPLIRYSIYLRQTPDQTSITTEDFVVAYEEELTTASTTSDTCTVSSLLANTSYDVYATYANVQGESVPGDRATFQTNKALDLPSPPLNLHASFVSAGNIELEWDLPDDLGGASDVVGYIVYQKYDVAEDGYFTLYDNQNSTARNVMVRGLIRDTSYAFAVAALTTASFSANPASHNLSPFDIVQTLTASHLAAPGQPVFVSATGGAITFRWTAPTDLAGVDLVGYNVELANTITGTFTTLVSLLSSNVTEFTHYGLSESTSYSYAVTAVNQDGPSGRSSLLTTSTAAVSSPASVQVIRANNVTGGSVLLVWEAPLDSGGRNIAFYEIIRAVQTNRRATVQYESTSSDSPTTFYSTNTTFEDRTGLRALTSYTYQISGFNGLNSGAVTSFSVTTGPPSISDPVVFRSVIPFGGRLDVTWDPPENTGGIPIDAYVITLRKPEDGQIFTIANLTTTATAQIFWGLIANTVYYLSGEVINSQGSSKTVEYVVTTGPPDAPYPPPPPIATAVRGGSVDITVQNTIYTGGEDVAMALYKGGTQVYSFSQTARSVTIYGLIANTYYVFSVSARNSIAEIMSGSMTLMTTDISTPGKVQNVKAVFVSFDRMTLSWDSVQDTGGDENIQYYVTYFNSTSDGVIVGDAKEQTSNSNEIMIQDLNSSSYYSMTVAARTSTGLIGDPAEPFVVATEPPLSGVIIASASNVSVVENAGNAFVTVARVNGSYGDVSFSFETFDDSAVDGQNYQHTAGSQTLPPYVKNSSVVIPILNDTVYNPNVSFTVVITDSTTAQQTTTRVFLTDDGDAGSIYFVESSVRTLENQGIVSLTLARSGGVSPKAVIQPMILQNASSIDRFHVLNSTLTFEVGDAQHNLLVEVINDDAFQYVPDRIMLSFTTLEGGVLYGSYKSINLTAVDDGDISLPKPCLNVSMIFVTGGAIGLQWIPPVDRGGVDIALTYLMNVVLGERLVISHLATTESGIVYGLNQSTTYNVSIQAVNPAGAGLASTPLLLTTSSATAPSAPQYVQVLSVSSSSALVSWDAPLDSGGSPIVNYMIYNVSGTTSQPLFPAVSCMMPTLCTINRLMALTTYTVQIRGSSALVMQGLLSDITEFMTSDPVVPDEPPAPNITWVSAGAMTVQMFDPENVGGSNIQQYNLFVRADGDTEFTTVYSGGLSQFTVYRLRRQTVYQIKYQAVNSVGPSPFSPVVSNETLERSLPSAPINVTLANRTGGAITLNWSEPLDVGGRSIIGYTIKLVGVGNNSVDPIGYDGKGDPSRQGTVYGLTANTLYGMQVVAYVDVSNCFDASLQSWSKVFNASTGNATAPATAPELRVKHFTGGIIELHWLQPKDTGGIPLIVSTLYLIDGLGHSSVLNLANDSSLQSFVHNNLTAMTSYSYWITTSNAVGASPRGDIFNATTDIITTASAPLNVRQLAYNTGGAISLGWDSPIDMGGQAIAEYTIYRNNTIVGSTQSPDTKTFVDKRLLTANTSYVYAVRAVGLNGMISIASDEFSIKTIAATPPQQAQSVSAIAGSSYLNVMWIPDDDTGGMSVKLYEVKLMLGSALVGATNVTTSYYRFTGLSAQTAYTASVNIYNDVGSSPLLESNMTTTTMTEPDIPDAPLPISVFGGNFTIKVNTPLLTGGSTVIAMKVFESTSGNVAMLNITNGTSAVYTFYGVIAESSYFVSCSAINAKGESLPSAQARIRTAVVNQPGPLLLAPVLLASTGLSITFQWIPPADNGGSTALTYQTRVVDSTGTAVINPSSGTSYNATQLAFDSVYNISVRARNTSGDWSPTLTVRTQPDKPGEFNFAQSSVSVIENASQIALPVQRVSGLNGRITLNYSAEPFSYSPAKVGTNIAVTKGSNVTNGTIIFDALQSANSIAIQIMNDDVFQNPPLMFLVRLTNASSGALVGRNNTMAVTILDDGDAGYVSFEKPAFAFSEGVGTANVSIAREYGKNGRISLSFSFGNGTATADYDYRKAIGPVVMEDGVTKANLTITIINDRIYEFPDEFFFIQMFVDSGGARLNQSTTVVTILDDGDAAFAITTVTLRLISRTGGSATFSAEQNGSSSAALSNYVVRLSTSAITLDLNKPVTPKLLIGGLTANTIYNVSIAGNTSFGLGDFSNVTTFSTTSATLPGATKLVTASSSTGGRLSLSWEPPEDTGGIPITKYRVHFVDSQGLFTIAAENLQSVSLANIYGLNASTSYVFSVQAGNSLANGDQGGWGLHSTNFTFSTTSPTQPTAVSLSPRHYKPPTGGKIVLSWTTPLDAGGVNITSYAVYARTLMQPWFLAANVTGLYAPVAQLNASTTYEFVVVAENSVMSLELPGKLSLAEGSRVLRTSVDLSSWLSIGSVIAVQNAVFVVASVASGSVFLTYPNSLAAIQSQIGELLGVTANSTVLNTTTPTLPEIPPAPLLSVATGGMLNLTLLPPADTGGVPIVGYSVYWNGQELHSESYAVTASKMSYLNLRALASVPRLEPMTSYTISAVARNSFSLCYFGRDVTGPTAIFHTSHVTAPGMPGLVTFRTTGGGITMNLINPHDTGGDNITLYRLYYKQNGTANPWKLGYEGAKHQATVARLTSLTDYAFMASVSNDFYTSLNSSVKVVKTTNKSPPGSTIAAVLVNATGGMLQVAWDYPLDDGGSNVTGFYATIASSLDGSGRMTVRTQNPSCSFFRLLAQSSYNVVIRASNDIGIGPESDSATFVASLGSAPSGFIAVNVTQVTGGAAKISFDEPIDLGGVLPSDINYNFFLDRDNIFNMSYAMLENSVPGGERRLAVSIPQVNVATVFSNIVVGYMDPETLYSIQVRPVNRFASGNMSSSFAVQTTALTIPSAPTGLKLESVTGGSVSLSWKFPVDLGGVPVNHFSVSLSTSQAGPFSEMYNDTLAGSTIDQLAPNTQYWASVKASNDIGISPASSTLVFSTRSVTPPSSPLRVTILSVSFDTIECEWLEPKDTGGDTIASYRITATQTDDPTNTNTFTVTATSASLTGLNPSTVYSVSVVAFNTFGDSSVTSATRYASTSSALNIPSTPRIGCVSHGSVELVWYAYPGATAYRVLRDGAITIDSTTNTFVTDTIGLSAGTTFSYTVLAKVGSGFGPSSAAIAVTTLLSSDSIYAVCTGSQGHITELSYSNNVNKRWRIDMATPATFITLTFSLFALECDHDYVEISDSLTGERLWKGGCSRTGHFFYQAAGPIFIDFSSDSSVTNQGFELQYELDGSDERTRIPPPTYGTVCSSHGRGQSNGSCKCSVGFTGEGCNNRIVCCSNPQRCHHPVCDIDPNKVIVVSVEFGDDTQGTGEMMEASEKGTASKAVKTISRALDISVFGSIIFVYPGVYSGALNRDLAILSTNLTITSLKGPYWTSIDCTDLSRFMSSTESKLSVVGITLNHCKGVEGGAFKITGGDFVGENMRFMNCHGSQRGGALFASNSVVTFNQVNTTDCSADMDGGAIYVENSKIAMIDSNVTKCSASRGGAVALAGTSFLTVMGSMVFGNTATDSGGAVFATGDASLGGIVFINNQAPAGGAIAVDNGVVRLENCVIENNTAHSAGGGIATTGKADLEFTNTSIRTNQAGYTGGGMNAVGTIAITFARSAAPRSTIVGNQAPTGAGLYILNAQADLNGINVENGTASESGGGVAIVDSTVTWSDILIKGNAALDGGGVFLRNSHLNSQGSVLLTNNDATDGGAFWISMSTMQGVDGTTCLFNKAVRNGGAVFIDGTVSVANVKHESNEAPSGGCMYVSNAALSLAGVDFTKCLASDFGGGIYATGSNVTMDKVTISLATAADGGGIFVDTSSISGDMVVAGCSADNHGGGLYLTGNSSIVGTTVEKCDAKEGGAMYVTDSNLLVENVHLIKSSASDRGGGLCSVNSVVELTEMHILQGHSDSLGGGVFLDNSIVVHDGISVQRCDASNGGGMYLQSSAIKPMGSSSSSQITQNEASDSGGNVFLVGDSSLGNLIISSGIADSGGGVATSTGTATIQKCSIANNTATFGGGFALKQSSICILVNSVVATNNASETGGGINLADATIMHDGASILSNIAPTGAGIFGSGHSAIVKRKSTSTDALVQANNATYSTPTEGYGGGLYIATSSFLEVDGVVFRGGAAYRGAGIYVDGSTLVLTNSFFTNGTASSGGGIYANWVSNVTLGNCSFDQNYASQSGGAIGSSGNLPSDRNILFMENCSLTNNSAQIFGGAMMLSLTDMSCSNNVLKENIAVAGSGGGIAILSEGTISLTNWSLTNNTVGKALITQGGSIYATGGAKFTITDSNIVSNEEAMRVRSGGLIYIETGATMNISNSLLEFGQSFSGGLVYSVDASVFIENSTLHRGYAYDFGAGIFGINSLVDVRSTLFYDNFAFYSGGAIYMKYQGKLSIHDSLFDLNSVKGGGGAIYLNSGATVACTIHNTKFTRNKNVGYGSVLFAGRQNTVQLTNCSISGNGGVKTEGGTIYAADAVVILENSLIATNKAVRGAAMEISRASNVSLSNTVVRNNSVSMQGGALYVSMTAILTIIDSVIDENTAGEGGALFAVGSPIIALERVSCRSNMASSFGGAFSLRASVSVVINSSDFDRNKGFTGGAISLQENASFSIVDSQFQDNEASDFGAGLYIDKATATHIQSVKCKASRFGGNVAVAGDDIYWVYYPWFTFACVECESIVDSGGLSVATSATTITPGWWPPVVTSGISLGVDLSIAADSSGMAPATPPRRLTLESSSSSSALTTDIPDSLNSSLVKPGSTTLWPTLVVRDYYGAIATYANTTQCRAFSSTDPNEPFYFTPGTWIAVDSGYIVFKNAEVLSTPKDFPYKLNISCMLSQGMTNLVNVNVTVGNCNPGYENVNNLCIPCEKGTYSLDGAKCYLCPGGATCELQAHSGAVVGTTAPRRSQGYFISHARSSYVETNCHDPSSWLPDDPCKSVGEDDLTIRIHKCSSLRTFEKYWSRRRIYACLSGNEYYECETNAACVQSNASAMTASTESISQCEVGYGGVLCATCTSEFYKVSSGSCKHCSDPDDPAVAHTVQMLAIIPMAAVIFALVLIIFIFSDTSEQRVVKHAQAAKRFQVYREQSTARILLLAAKAKLQRRVQSMMDSVIERTRLGKNKNAYLFHIEPQAVPVPLWRPEKFKIMLGFFQILGSYKAVYDIPWPDDMSHLLDICSIADFNFVDSTAAECLFQRDYFKSYRLEIFSLLGALALVCLLLGWGILRYRVKLATLPRHCVNCGLPVFKLIFRKPPIMDRRAKLLAKLKKERTIRLAALNDSKSSRIMQLKAKLWNSSQNVVAHAKSSRVVKSCTRMVDRVSLLPQIAASISYHEPTCPTTQRIRGDVLEMVVYSNLRLWRARVWMRLYYKSYQNKCIKLFFWILLLFYPMLSQRVIGSFYCDEIGESFYMRLDHSNLCYDGAWLFYLPINITLIIFWVLGVPMLFWAILFHKRSRGVDDMLLLIQDPSQEQLRESLVLKMRLDITDRGQVLDEDKLETFEEDLLAQYLRDRNLNEPSTVAQVGFIYHSYNTAFWWFEVWDLGRKLLLNCVVSLLAKAGANRICCGLVVLLVYLSVMLFYKPYRERSDSALAGVTHIQLFITLFCGLILKMGSLYLQESVVWLVTYTAIITSLGTLSYAVFSILNEKVTGVKIARRRSREAHRRAIAAQVRKLWRQACGYALAEIYLRNPDAGPMSLLVMVELARRSRCQREKEKLGAQVELAAAVHPTVVADEPDSILFTSQIAVEEGDSAAPDMIGTNEDSGHNDSM